MYHAYGRDPGAEETRLAQWKQVAKSGVVPDMLANRPECPPEALHLWELHIRVAQGGKAGLPELAAYQQLTGLAFTPFEMEALLDLEKARTSR